MVSVVGALAVALLCAVATLVATAALRVPQTNRRAQIYNAVMQVEAAARETKREINRAAGQSWRNILD